MAADEIANASRKLNAWRPARSIHHRMPAMTDHRTHSQPTQTKTVAMVASRATSMRRRQGRALAVRDRLGPATHNETAQTATATSTTGMSGRYEPVASKAAAPR